eukprot:CAMPEP_0202338430 /NCGR_PEP_ID=MMETSP1126-20121109/708_1 /ASSEMBLY_ACC=CAM_ASM_000457 /TAXON_ID=3047 /ORGANISM="Dunaliella tertiolecta, Strain CCMP1320" /LENGTH=62 /DNA_ID=CAMNT_0048928805 /DNA_START=380 /DNA_END=568 /DNA_ORIENTATION=-
MTAVGAQLCNAHAVAAGQRVPPGQHSSSFSFATNNELRATVVEDDHVMAALWYAVVHPICIA